MRIKKSAFMLSSVAIMSLFAGCQEYEFTDITAEEIRYEKNFTEKFGDISNVPTWDFSTYNLNRLGLVGGPSNKAVTRATGAEVYENDTRWFYVPAGIEQWLTANLKEGENNTTKGTKDFTLSMPSNDVLLIPVYQGQAGLVWDLYVTDGTIGDNSVTGGSTNERIWSKSEGIQVKKAGTGSSGSVTYTNNIVASQTFTHTGYTNYNNGNDKIIQLYEYLQSMSFNASTQWFKIEISNIDNNFNNVTAGLQYIHEVSGSNKWENFPSTGKQISGNSVTFECKDEEFLRNVMKSTGDDQLKFSIWSGGGNPSNASQVNNITITIYEKTTSGGTNDSDWQNVTALSNNENNRNTIGETIRAHAIKLKQDAFAGTFSMYLKVTNLNEEYYQGHYYSEFASRANQASTAGQMLALTELNTNTGYLSTVLTALQDAYGSEDYKFMFLGCEDANTGKSDWDMNDIVFLLVGKELPEIHDKDTEVIKKRYMIEDLGGTYDFDFNDIVVDVTRVTKYTGDTPTSVTTKATLKHLSGTIPFKVKIGNTVFGPFPGKNGNSVQGGDGYDPTNDDTYSSFMNADVDGWDPTTNNITVTTWPGMAEATSSSDFTDTDKNGFLGNLGEGTTFSFPESGKMPYIIACDQSVQWMKELITIPTTWFNVTPKNSNPIYGDDTPGSGDDPGDNPGSGDDPGSDPADDTVTLPWTGSQTVTWDDHLKVNKSSFADVKIGDKISVTLSNSTSFKLCINIPGNWTEFATYNSNSCEYTIETQEMVDNLKAYGLEIQGQDATLTSIKIISSDSGQGGQQGGGDQGGVTTLFEGNISANNNGESVPRLTFTDEQKALITSGKTIKVYCTVTGWLKFIPTNGWTEITATNNSGYRSIAVTNDNVNTIKDGIRFQGENATITKVTIE